jgi:hypothetical protein
VVANDGRSFECWLLRHLLDQRSHRGGRESALIVRLAGYVAADPRWPTFDHHDDALVRLHRYVRDHPPWLREALTVAFTRWLRSRGL